MGHLLEELLELQRIGRVVGELPALRPDRIARQAGEMVDAKVAPSTPRSIVDAMPEVSVDRMRLTEVYQNLIENAIKFRRWLQPAQGLFRRQRHPRYRCCRPVRSPTGSSRVTSDRDNGIGIAPEYHDLVFGLFERLSMDVLDVHRRPRAMST